MDDLFFNNEMPDDQLLFATDIILDSTLESNLNQYGITGSKHTKVELDQNYNESKAELNELDPDANLFLYLNDHSDQACINLAAAHKEKTEMEEQTTTQHISTSSFISSVGINDQIGDMDLNQIDYMDQSILFAQEAEYVETETDQMNNMRGPDNRHRKGPSQLSKEDIKDDSKWKNVKRCRVTRKTKNFFQSSVVNPLGGEATQASLVKGGGGVGVTPRRGEVIQSYLQGNIVTPQRAGVGKKTCLTGKLRAAVVEGKKTGSGGTLDSTNVQ